MLLASEKLLVDMFSKRKTLAVRYDDALEVVDGNEGMLQRLISHGVVVQVGNMLELDDVYREFFEKVLEVNEDINTASVKEYIDRLKLSIESYLAAGSDRNKQQYVREVHHWLRSIDQTTRRNIIDLKRNVDYTYKQQPDFNIKRLRLNDFDRKGRDIASLIHHTEALFDTQPIFFSNATDLALQHTVHEVKAGLDESAHALIDIQKQIVDYLHRIDYQGRIVKRVRQLKYLKDQFMLEEATTIKAVLAARNDVWMEPAPRYSTKVSIDFLRNDASALDILRKVRRKIGRKAMVRQRLAGAIAPAYLEAQQEEMRVYDHEELFSAFNAQGKDLFRFLTEYDFHRDTSLEDRLVLFLQMATQFADNIVFTGQTHTSANIEYPIINPL